MKKSKLLVALLLAILVLVTGVFTSCTSGDVQGLIDDNVSKVTPTKLDTPSNIELDEDYVLRWSM